MTLLIIPERHRLALAAALLPGDRGEKAFAEWSRRVPLDAVDHDEFRLLPLIYLRARERGCDGRAMGRLKGVYRQVWVKNTLLLETSARVVDLLRAADIPTLLLKGIAIFAHWAGTIGPRAMRDIDILVPRADARRAIAVLTRSGWAVKHFSMPDFADEDFERRHALTLCRDEARDLDLHWKALPRNTSPRHVDMFWSGSRTVEIMGRTTRVLRTEDQLYHSLLHGARFTDGASLDWMVDVFVLLRSQPEGFDWNRVAEHAHRDRSVPAISRQFKIFKEVLGDPIPLAKSAKWRRHSLLDVLASKTLEKSYDFLSSSARLCLEYHEFLVRDARPAVPSTFLSFVREKFVVERTLYRMPRAFIRLLGRPLTAVLSRPSGLREERRLPCIDRSAAWDAARNPFLFGWSYPETGGRWTIEAQAILGFRDTADRSTDLLVTAEIRPYLTKRHQRLTVDAIVNGCPCGTWRFVGQETIPAVLTFIVPSAARSGAPQALLVTFVIRSPARPSEVDASQDIRTLGFFFERMRFTTPGPSERLEAKVR